MTKQKLQLEIKQLRQREKLYDEKRKELMALEQKYRRNQDIQMTKKDKGNSKGETNNLILKSINDSVWEERRQIQVQQCAIDDLDDKMEEMKENIATREQERDELNKLINQRKAEGDRLIQQCNDMNNNNRDLEEKLRKRKADMEELKRKRVSLEQQNWGLDDTIRREKQKLFED